MALYDIHGNELGMNHEGSVEHHDNSVTTLFPQLADSGYTFVSEKVGECNSVLLFDFNADRVQSVGYDYESGCFYKFADVTTVLKFNDALEQIATINMPSSAGHCNDAFYYEGKFYLPDGSTGNSDGYAERLYVWDAAENTVSIITVNGICNPSNGSKRQLCGGCEIERGSGKFYLVCRDVYTSDIEHQDGDKLSVYLYDLESNVASLVAEYDWDCVYVQGCTCVNGILYVACNTQTTNSASNYKGITLKVIDTLGWKLIDELICEGSFEPEGMDFVRNGSAHYLIMGMAKYGSLAIAVLFRTPY